LFLLVSGVSEGLWRFRRIRGLLLFTGMLLVDGVYLSFMTHATGGSVSPLRYVVLLHLIVATLLASYRTGLKLAFWHSLLLFVVFHAQQGGLLTSVEGNYQGLPGSDYERLSGFVLAFWLVALVTASFSAINERELRRRRIDLEALAELATRIERMQEPTTVAQVVADSLVSTFGFERALVLAAPDGDPALLASTMRNAAPSAESGVDLVVRQAGEDRRTLLLRRLDPDQNPRLARLLPNANNVAVVPLLAEGRSIGVLVAEHNLRHGSRIEERVVAMAGQFAAHAALKLDNAWLLAEVQTMAETDALTRVANRRTFEAALERELARATRAAEPVSLVMVDIDHFKLVNDTHGHQVGDDVLQIVAHALGSECRAIDTLARYGGEEFAVILPTCDAAEAVEIAERLRQAVASAPTPVKVTSSAGVATYPLDSVNGAALVKAADEALYESKRNGRNRVTSASAATTEVASAELWETLTSL
jgi:diguanylate cyclase (GGDEF)-like protein